MGALDNYFIKIIFLTHATLVYLICIINGGDNYTTIYTSYNTLLLLCLLLTVSTETGVGVLIVSMAFETICMALDVAYNLVPITPNHNATAEALFVINLLFRPIAIVLLARSYRDRSAPSSSIDQSTRTSEETSTNQVEVNVVSN